LEVKYCLKSLFYALLSRIKNVSCA
jgi:hypothetical protein